MVILKKIAIVNKTAADSSPKGKDTGYTSACLIAVRKRSLEFFCDKTMFQYALALDVIQVLDGS